MLSWDISEDGDKVEIFNELKEVVMKISISELRQAADSKKARRFFKITENLERIKDMPKSKANLSITVSEAKAFCEWFLEHTETCPYIKDHGDVFTKIHFKTTHETGIGATHIVTCDCGEEYDITDVTCW